MVVKIMLGVTVVILPLMIVYNRYLYRVFGGKVKAGSEESA